MSSSYVFNGRSRPTHISLSRDHQPSKETIVSDVRKKREERERDRKRKRAAECIQRNTRRWLSRMLLAKLAADAFETMDDGIQQPPGRRLEELCWDYEFVCRGMGSRSGFSAKRRMYAGALLQQLSCSIRAGTLGEEFSCDTHVLDLLVRLVLAECAVSPDNEEVDPVWWKEKHVALLGALFKAASTLTGRVDLVLQGLRFLIEKGTTGNEAILSIIHDFFATISVGELGNTLVTPAVHDMLLQALTSSICDKPFVSPTICVFSVLLGSPAEEKPVMTDGVNQALVQAMIDVAVKKLPTALSTQPMVALGKLVRLAPLFFEAESEDEVMLRKNWMVCLSHLAHFANRKGELIRTTLRDLHHPRTDTVPRHGRYKHPQTYLFSTECGLKLLEQGAVAAAALRTQHEGGLEPSATQLESYCNFDTLCGIFVWPLYTFMAASPEQRIEATTIISKLVHSPRVLQSLWRVYQDCHSSTFGGLTKAKKADYFRQAMEGEVVHLPWGPEPPAEMLDLVSSTAPTRSLFWDPYPAVSTLLFSLLSYFVDATDFVEGLKRCTLMDHDDAFFLVLALKGIVNRSHFHGIVPQGNSEAVVEAALTLLVKLHVINEAHSFVSYPSVWITTSEPISAFDSVTTESWMYVKTAVETAVAAKTGEESGDISDDNNDWGVGETNDTSIHHPKWAESCMWSRQERCVRILQNAPFTIPFKVRAALFTTFLLSRGDRQFIGGQRLFLVHRSSVFIDAFDRFAAAPDSPDMYSVRFRDTNDIMEEGYGEGVYREFLLSLCTEGFAAEHGLFRLTHDGYVYPNPFSYEVTGDPLHLQRINFLGSMVGRALRDGVLQDVPFALHFRNAMLGRSNSINNLECFDQELYRHLVSLLSLSEEEIESLSLNFTYTVDVLGEARELELLRDGYNIPVTRRNCLNYIHLVADFKLNRESARQTKAFLSGLGLIVDRSWLRLFDGNEIMKLFGGDAESAIDVLDWEQHTIYHDAKDEGSTPVRLFWHVVESMSSEQQKKLLKFSTSMNRPPLLGFKFLNPPFKLHVVWDAPEQRLPSASTCFSTLKLPPYKDMDTAWRKITAAIEETDDFGLS
ncbi:putative ubiquitin-protein ligase [Trypanosoma grayi]|uniref:putative ubiquitin-protein ligase n=1 Tax=Trypanosoma grayi TaxID=71804 RepID=UPI0004F46163|nr:putative ubiquitin-protein ligase [Trypanosoma grayi]KEG13505.1 putative ubiquitin-protein ligase [Trypanosoma grayi]